MAIVGQASKTYKLDTAHRRTIDFVQVLDRLGSAELFLVSALHQSLRNLEEDISLLRVVEREGAQVADEVAILRAESAYTRTILYDFLDKVITQDRPPAHRRVGQAREIEERGILSIINNHPCEPLVGQQAAANRDEAARQEQNENIAPNQRTQRNGRNRRRVRQREVPQPPPAYE